MNEHTPGPWHADAEYVVGGDGRAGFRPGGEVIAQAHATITGPEMRKAYPQEERRANAQLMAAAPDLLEALRLADEALDVYSWWVAHPGSSLPPTLDSVFDRIDAAIARATGEER